MSENLAAGHELSRLAAETSHIQQRWTTDSACCSYVLDSATQTLSRNGDVIAEHVTHAQDMRKGGWPTVYYGNGSSISTGRAVTFEETVREPLSSVEASERPADCGSCGCFDNAHEWSFVQASSWCHSCGQWCDQS